MNISPSCSAISILVIFAQRLLSYSLNDTVLIIYYCFFGYSVVKAYHLSKITVRALYTCTETCIYIESLVGKRITYLTYVTISIIGNKLRQQISKTFTSVSIADNITYLYILLTQTTVRHNILTRTPVQLLVQVGSFAFSNPYMSETSALKKHQDSALSLAWISNLWSLLP